MKKIHLLFFVMLCSFKLFCQSPNWVWAKSAAGNDLDDCTTNSTTDNLGNLYITGSFSSNTITFGNITLINFGLNNKADILIVKYDPSGNVVWAKSAGGVHNDTGHRIAVDDSGNVYITGSFTSPSILFGNLILNNPHGNNPSPGNHIYIAKYDSSGNPIWAKDAGGGSWDSPNDISTDLYGNIYVSGQFIDTLTFGNTTLIPHSSGSSNVFIAKYSSLGNPIWANGLRANNSRITTDASGNLYITAQYSFPDITLGNVTLFNQGIINSDDFILAKYNPSGSLIWAKNIGGNNEDFSTGITIDGFGNIYITGGFYSSTINFGGNNLSNAGDLDAFIVKYDSSGNYTWAKSAGGSNGDLGTSISKDVLGNVYITGVFASLGISFGNTTLNNPNSSGLYYDIFIFKFDSNGNDLWSKVINAGSYNFGNSNIAIDPSNNVYIAGFFDAPTISFGTTILINNNPGYSEIFTAKLSSTVGIKETENENLVSIYPNPFSINTIINLKNKSDYVFELYDALGQKVNSKEIHNANSLEINRDNLPNGIYFYQIISEDNNRSSGKLIIQ